MSLSESTVLFFSSDNGPDVLDKWHGTSMCKGTSYPLYGHKYQLHEGGTRVPGMIRWPGKVQPGVSDQRNITLDWLPTVCEITGQRIPSGRKIDGTILLPHLLRGEPIERGTPMYWQFEHPIKFGSMGDGYRRRLNGKEKLQTASANVSIRRGQFVLRAFGDEAYAAPTKLR